MQKRKYEICDINWKIIIGYSSDEDDDIITEMIMSKSPFLLRKNPDLNIYESIIIIPNNIISISVTEI